MKKVKVFYNAENKTFTVTMLVDNEMVDTVLTIDEFEKIYGKMVSWRPVHAS